MSNLNPPRLTRLFSSAMLAVPYDGATVVPHVYVPFAVIVVLNGRVLDDLEVDTSSGTQLTFTGPYLRTLDNLRAINVAAMSTVMTQDGAPIGTISAYAGNSAPPAGYAWLRKSKYDKTTYAALYAVIGDVFNDGTQSASQFMLPDIEGRFLRAFDAAGLVDAGRVFGSKQEDDNKSHTHGARINTGAAGSGFTTIYNSGTQNNTTDYIQTAGGVEARPKNIALNYIIKITDGYRNPQLIDMATVSASLATLQGDMDRLKSLQTQGGFKHLMIQADGVTRVLQLVCTDVIAKDSAGVSSLIPSIIGQVNLATTGFNGLDQGALAGSSMYSLWSITNRVTHGAVATLVPSVTGNTTINSPVITGLVSTTSLKVGMPLASAQFPGGTVVLSIDGPTQVTANLPAFATQAAATIRFIYEPFMPLGYTAKARIGCFLTDGSGVPLAYTQFDKSFRFDPQLATNLLAYPTVATGAAATAISVSLLNLVPPTAIKAAFVGGTTTGYVGFSPEGGFTSTPGTGYLSPAQPNGFPFAGGYNASGPVPTTTGEIVLRRMSVRYSASAAPTILQLMGWEDSL